MQQAEVLNFQKQLYAIDIFEDDIVLTEFNSEGSKRTMLINEEQLSQLFPREITFKPQPGLVWMKDNGSAVRWLYKRPASTKPETVFYNKAKKTHNVELEFPNILMHLVTAQGRVDQIELFCYAEGELTNDTSLYLLPLPNYTGRNTVCLGSTHLYHSGNLAETFDSFMFDSAFNTHFDSVGNEQIKFMDYVKKYEGKVPISTLKCVGKAYQVISGGVE